MNSRCLHGNLGCDNALSPGVFCVKALATPLHHLSHQCGLRFRSAPPPVHRSWGGSWPSGARSSTSKSMWASENDPSEGCPTRINTPAQALAGNRTVSEPGAVTVKLAISGLPALARVDWMLSNRERRKGVSQRGGLPRTSSTVQL